MFFWIYDIPTWQLGLLIVCSIVTVSCLGLYLSRSWLHQYFDITQDSNDTLNGLFAGMGMLYGLLLGLVAVATWENYQSVDSVAGHEATVIGQLYRDVSTLKEPEKTLLQQDLKEYLNYVIHVAWPAHRHGESPAGGATLLTHFLGTLSTYHASSQEQVIFMSEVFTTYNKLIEARRSRLQAVDSGIPPEFWYVILLCAGVTVFSTYLFHVSPLRTHLFLTALFSGVLGLMIFLVAAVDHPLRGEVSVSPDAYQAVLDSLGDLDFVRLAPQAPTEVTGN